METKRIPFLVFIIIALFGSSIGNPLAGVVNLDKHTFNKTVKAFKFSFIKIDEGYPRGEKHDNWGALGRQLAEVDDILIAEVRVKEHGDKANQDLVEQWNWPFKSNEQYPEFVLLIKEGRKGFKETRYGGETSTEEFKAFLKHKTGIYLSLPGCSQKLDALAEEFVVGSNRADVVKKFEDEENAERYLKVTKLVAKKGFDALQSEEIRIKKLLENNKSTSEAKREDLTLMLNVLRSFQNVAPPKKKQDEL